MLGGPDAARSSARNRAPSRTGVQGQKSHWITWEERGAACVGKKLTGLGGAGSAEEVMGTAVGWMLPLPRDVCILAPEAQEYSTFQGTGALAEGLK